MRVSATTQAPAATAADTLVVGVFADEDVAHDTSDGVLGALLGRGEAKRSFKHLAVTHAGDSRWIVAGLGAREAFDAERARQVAAAVLGRAKELGTTVLCWEVPQHVGAAVAAGLVEGTLLADYRFDRFKRSTADDADADEPAGIDELILSDHHDLAAVAERAAVIAAAQNAARDLQNRPANDLTPTALAVAAREVAATTPGLDVDVLGGDAIREHGMGSFAAVFQASTQEPALIVVRYTPAGTEDQAPLGLIGKAVTFDTGGLTIKTGAGMVGMKFDMSGGAAVLQAIAAIARLELPIAVLAVIGATDNVISGDAVKPGDIVRAADGTTIEINNTDAEGRLVLADCLLYARELGAGRLVDVATLTGGVVTALGSVYAGLMSNDDELAGAVRDAGDRSGELVWRLPLHQRYADGVKGVYADLTNTGRDRNAHPIMGGEFLHHFAGDTPWAHLDIAGVANDAGPGYVSGGGTGFGVRLLVELATALAADR